ncbi:MAG: DUF4912 domain-containing protein [Candidatus Omnitrophica bacterium]|nr:DUF4912 domain-containing protein [Candidatus Omnitrophota bacterium]
MKRTGRGVRAGTRRAKRRVVQTSARSRQARRVPASVISPSLGFPPDTPVAPSAHAPAVPAQEAARQRRAAEARFVIPSGYGDHRIVLMVKDPWWLYAYWEIQPRIERQVRNQLAPEEAGGLRSVLRVYDVTNLPDASGATTGREIPQQPARSWCDIILSGLASSWYIHTNAPNRSFIVDIGLLTRTGRFLPLARSNRVTTPRFGPSDVIDDAWMSLDEDYWRLFGLTAGVGMGSSPSAFKALIEQRLLSSPGLYPYGLFSPVDIPKTDAFGLRVDAELVVYGATDPKAAVTIQGEPVHLRPDGSFSVRMTLPDGTQTIPVEATSSQRYERRVITPIVSRRTEGWRAKAGRRKAAVATPSAAVEVR